MEERFAKYLFGKAPAWALGDDQRFAYFTYIPTALRDSSAVGVPVIAAVHGTERGAERCRNDFAELAEQHHCIVVAPLFPCGVVDRDDMDNYKRIEFHGIRFDLVLLRMVEEVESRYGVRTGQLLMHGFSGGGQFAQRFYILHPHRLAAVSIGAPGAVTLLDGTRDWWVGTRDLEARFGAAPDLESMRRVRVQSVIGGEDLGADEVVVPESSRHWMPDANHAGGDRQTRISALRSSFESCGIDVEHCVVPDVGHDPRAVIPSVVDFFDRVLSAGSD